MLVLLLACGPSMSRARSHDAARENCEALAEMSDEHYEQTPLFVSCGHGGPLLSHGGTYAIVVPNCERSPFTCE